MTSFAIWNLLGNIAHIALTQGTNVLLNLFFGPIVNAAYGVSFKVRETINQFVVNIQLAIKPQIIKSYAANDFTYTIKLMFMGAKYSFFLLFVITLPLLFEMDTVLNIWLTEVPKYTTDLTKLGIMFIWIECISQSLMSVAQATGKIKLYQAVIGVLMLLNLPISYIFLKFGFEPVITILVSITIAIIALFTRLFLVKRLIYFKIQDYIQNVILKILVIISTGFIVPYLVTTLMEQSILRLFFTIASSTLWSSVCIYFLGLNKKEKKYTLSYMHKYKAKLFF